MTARHRPGWRRPSLWLALLLTALPLLVAFTGPWWPLAPPRPGMPSDPHGGGPFGTDFAGRDVLTLTRHGGSRAVLVAVAATVATQVVGVTLGLVAGLTRRPWLDELLTRPWDVVLAIPTLLLVMTAAALSLGDVRYLAGVVVVVGVGETLRMTRAASREAGARPVVEAMLLMDESWWRICAQAVLPRTWRVLLAAACLQLTSSLGLVATAAFLGAGVSAQDADWAAMVEANRAAIALQPWAVVLPCLLLASLTVGVTLLASQVAGPERAEDDALARLEQEARP